MKQTGDGLHWTLGYKGSVNRWECDENDHLNVRFYSRMAGEAVIGALAAWGEAGRATLRWQHMRYLAEARLATPVSGYVTPLAVDDTGYTLLVALRHSLTDNVLATAIGTWTGDGHTIPAVAHAIPAYAAPRGIADADTPFGSLALDAARAHGFATVGKGVIARRECGMDDLLPPDGMMGRISDAMPNLWALLQTEAELAARSDGFVGGAVLEYRMHHHGALKAGSRYEIISGVRDVTEKLQHFVHLCFDLDTGCCVTSAQAVGVVLDLVARRAVPIPADRRQRMLSLRLKPVA
ncbi:MAG: hypothetical protein H6993_12625 [Pseudomonadales bacterium]|nr:hypothetical protein [Pseudomonadales bacterium]